MTYARSSKNRILITGGGGFIGSNFLRYISRRKDISIIAPRRNKLDILNIDQLKKTFEKYCPDVVINYAAYRDANSAEKQRGDYKGSVWNANVVGVMNISRLSSTYGSFFIHISTDMVFSGREDHPGPYSELEKPETELRNLSWYGWTKAEAERRLSRYKNVAIIRIGNVTQPIYDPKLDYVGKIIYLYDKKKLYPLFHDQNLTLTSIQMLFEIIEILISKKRAGIFHAATKDTFTPIELGKYLIARARGKAGDIKSMSIDDYLNKFPARYPKFGGLKAKETSRKLGIKLRSWKEVVDSSLNSFKE